MCIRDRVKVFDVSQTDGKPLPELASSLSGNVPNYEAFMEALRRSAPVPITFEAMAADTDGYFSAEDVYKRQLLHRRDAPTFEGGADRRLYGGNLEAIQKMGRYSDRYHPECQRPAFQP